MILATTTSVRDSGLLDALFPDFTRQTGIEVQVIAVGTGAALRMGRDGDADLLLTHSPSAEQKLVDDGIVIRRTPFMQNYFVIAGPADDPANVSSASSPIDAVQRIASSGSPWISRADDSGTNKREISLLEAAGLGASADWKGVVRTGSGMGLSLQVAGERRAYILSDIGTFLAFKKRVDLVSLSKPDDTLRNVYSVLQLDPKRFERPIRSNEASALADFLSDRAIQVRIGEFGKERFGRPLFTPLHPKNGTANDAVTDGEQHDR